MTGLHVVQGLAFVLVVALAGRTCRRVLSAASVDARFAGALRKKLAAARRARAEAPAAETVGQVDRAALEAFAGAAPASGVAQLLGEALAADAEGEDLGLAALQAYGELREALLSELRTLRVVGRMAVFVGVLFAVWFHLRLLIFPRGLEGLVAGALEAQATKHATLALVLALGTGFVAMVVRVSLVPVARETLDAASRLGDELAA